MHLSGQYTCPERVGGEPLEIFVGHLCFLRLPQRQPRIHEAHQQMDTLFWIERSRIAVVGSQQCGFRTNVVTLLNRLQAPLEGLDWRRPGTGELGSALLPGRRGSSSRQMGLQRHPDFRRHVG